MVLEAAVLKAAAAGKVIFGVCGGFQMLGDTLSDPLRVEAAERSKEGTPADGTDLR